MLTRKLTETEFNATFSTKMLKVTETAENVIDIWPYVHSIPMSDLEGQRIRDQTVESVYRSGDGRYDHVLVMTETKNVYLVIIVYLKENAVFGHRLLDLNREYGLT